LDGGKSSGEVVVNEAIFTFFEDSVEILGVAAVRETNSTDC